MKNFFKKFQNLFCYYGLTKEEYNNIKNQAYASNFNVWKKVNWLISIVFLGLTIYSIFTNDFDGDGIFYVCLLGYSLVVSLLFTFVFKEKDILPQFIIYLNMFLLFALGMQVSFNSGTMMGVTIMVELVALPLLIVDKPYFIFYILLVIDALYLGHVGMYKTPEAIQNDYVNITVYTIISIILFILLNTPRIREFQLTNAIEYERDIDSTTNLFNKNGLKLRIDDYLTKYPGNGMLFFMDLDNFKEVNDTFGHDKGDDVLSLFAKYLDNKFNSIDVIKGRFGGDEFVLFFKGEPNYDLAKEYAKSIIDYVNDQIVIPNLETKLSVSIGIALSENGSNATSLLKQGDTSLYKVKENGKNGYYIM